jgi:hypothetical protein
MTTTFQKRQKEMKRLDKQREKAARRAQRKLDKRAGKEAPADDGVSENLNSDPQRADPHGSSDPQTGPA